MIRVTLQGSWACGRIRCTDRSTAWSASSLILTIWRERGTCAGRAWSHSGACVCLSVCPVLGGYDLIQVRLSVCLSVLKFFLETNWYHWCFHCQGRSLSLSCFVSCIFLDYELGNYIKRYFPFVSHLRKFRFRVCFRSVWTDLKGHFILEEKRKRRHFWSITLLPIWLFILHQQQQQKRCELYVPRLAHSRCCYVMTSFCNICFEWI